ncbi:putative cyclase [Abortiporus biennis]|nr:putative cyclase [Abortiporus biennis]
MAIVDLSHILDETVQIYPGDPEFKCCPALTIDTDLFNVSSISLGSHTGTHIDAPYHIIKDGDTIEKVPLSRFVGVPGVIDLTGVSDRQRILWDDIQAYERQIINGVQSHPNSAMVFLRTDWSQYWGTKRYYDHPFLDKEVAQRLVSLGVKLIGVDTLSPDETVLEHSEEQAFDFGVHEVVLGSGGLIVENLDNLASIQYGEWIVSLVPLKLAGCDGSPIRAHAWRRDDL